MRKRNPTKTDDAELQELPVVVTGLSLVQLPLEAEDQLIPGIEQFSGGIIGREGLEVCRLNEFPLFLEPLEDGNVRSFRWLQRLHQRLFRHQLQRVMTAGQVEKLSPKSILNQHARTIVLARVGCRRVELQTDDSVVQIPVSQDVNDGVRLSTASSRIQPWDSKKLVHSS